MNQLSGIKQQLATLGAATEVGFRSSPPEAGRIRELATQLEALNPCPEPAQAAGLLRGRWRLLYSNFDLQRRTTLAHLSLGTCPPQPVEVVELYNEIDPATGLYDNVIYYLDADGLPGTLVIAGQYQADDERTIDLRYFEALVFGPGAPVRIPGPDSRIPSLKVEMSFLDDGFRLSRGAHGSLYVLERLDPAPMRWSRDG